MKTNRESWSYSAWRGEGLEKTLLTTLQYIKGACEKDGEGHFPKACSDKTKGSSGLN